MVKSEKPLRSIRSPKETGTISRTALRNAVKKVTARRLGLKKNTKTQSYNKKPDAK